jgi:site-specific recombinase XerC
MKGNFVYEHDVFNVEIKDKYLSSYSEATRQTVKRVFQVSAEMEHKLNQDLYQFNMEEVEQVLFSMKPPTLAASRANISLVNGYFIWAIGQGLVNENPVDQIRAVEDDQWLRKFITEKNSYVTEQELMQIEDWCVNAQDAVIFRLVWEGVYGHALSELSNLKMSDVDVENQILNLADAKGNHRQLQVSSRCIDLIKDAYKSDIYYKKNGEAVLEDYQREYVDLLSSEYVLKAGKTNTITTGQVNQHIILRRFKAICRMFDLEEVTTKSVAKSGMIKMAKDAMAKGEELNRELMERIANRYVVNFWWSLRDFITLEEIKKLYPED